MAEDARAVAFENQNGIGVIRFQNPPLNIMTNRYVQEFQEALDWAEGTKDLKVIVLCNQGKCFGAGADVNDMKAYLESHTYVSVKMHNAITIADRLANLPVPVIGAIDGMALGGGFELALACDLRVISENGKVALTEINFDSFPGMGGVPRLIALVGYSRAMKMMLFAEELDAEAACREGVVNAVAHGETACELAMRWAAELNQKAKSGLAAVKKMAHCLQKKEQDYLYLFSQNLSREVAESGALHRQCEAFINRKKKIEK